MATAISPKRRHACGKIRQPSKAEREAAQRTHERRVKQAVLDQPHRMGNSSQLCGSSWGRFCLEHKLDRALYDAGERYGNVYRQYAMLISERRVEGHVTGVWSGVEPAAETIDRIKQAYMQARAVLDSVSRWSYPTLHYIIVEEPTSASVIRGKEKRAAINGALALARHWFGRGIGR